MPFSVKKFKKDRIALLQLNVDQSPLPRLNIQIHIMNTMVKTTNGAIYVLILDINVMINHS